MSEEAANVPILNDLRDHDFLGPAFMRGFESGERRVLVRLLEQRFGQLPATFSERLATLSSDELEALSDRIFDAKSPEDLFR